MRAHVYYRQLKEHHNHWWFKSRKIILSSIIKKHFLKSIRILDYGCGAGNNLQMLSSFGEVYAYDNNNEITQILKKNFINNKKIKFVKNIKKYNNFFDLIIATDVIEHIQDDSYAVNFLSRLLKKNGKLILTVPAYNFLFSSKDKDLHHKRRYTKKSLNLILNKKFKSKIFTYYNFFLSPILIMSILYFKFLNIKFIKKAEVTPPNFVNNIFLKIFTFERFFINNNIRFPFGISLLFFGEKCEKN